MSNGNFTKKRLYLSIENALYTKSETTCGEPTHLMQRENCYYLPEPRFRRDTDCCTFVRPQQYERRLKKWGVRKNLKAKDWVVIGRRIAKRKAEDDKESKLTVDGYLFPPEKVLKAISRYQEGTIERYQRGMCSPLNYTK